jgi:hypothetical protein
MMADLQKSSMKLSRDSSMVESSNKSAMLMNDLLNSNSTTSQTTNKSSKTNKLNVLQECECVVMSRICY